jgi:hypothetical protein
MWTPAGICIECSIQGLISGSWRCRVGPRKLPVLDLEVMLAIVVADSGSCLRPLKQQGWWRGTSYLVFWFDLDLFCEKATESW